MPPRRQPDQTAPKSTSPTGNTNGEAAIPTRAPSREST